MARNQARENMEKKEGKRVELWVHAMKGFFSMKYKRLSGVHCCRTVNRRAIVLSADASDQFCEGFE